MSDEVKPAMSPLAVTSVLVNFLFATAPFTYPFGFIKAGPPLAVPLLCISCFFSYITSGFLIEAVSIANFIKSRKNKNSTHDETEMVGVRNDEVPPL